MGYLTQKEKSEIAKFLDNYDESDDDSEGRLKYDCYYRYRDDDDDD